jgi:hypothetical protein
MSIDESIGYRLGWNVVVPGLHLQTELFDSWSEPTKDSFSEERAGAVGPAFSVLCVEAVRFRSSIRMIGKSRNDHLSEPQPAARGQSLCELLLS